MNQTSTYQDHMDAQQIVLDTDPEAASTDSLLERTDRVSNKPCCCRALLWYISPISCNIGHSILCLLYHCINFGLAIALVTFDATAIGTSAGLLALFCVGIPLLWLSFEIVLILTRIDLGIVYYMVEQNSTINEARRHLLTLSIYFQEFPLCCCWNRDGSSMFQVMVNRMKYLFTSCDLCGYVCYQIFIKPFSCAALGIVIIVGINFGLIGVPIWYAVDNTMFKENKVLIGYSSDCEWPSNGGTICPQNYWWIINSFERALYLGITALLILPFTVRFSNYLAYLNKITIYHFYTYYYTKDEAIVQDKTSLLTKKTARINSV